MKMKIRCKAGGNSQFDTDGVQVRITDKVPNRFFLVKDEAALWRVVEYSTGAAIGNSECTRNTAIFNARKKVESVTAEMLETAIKEHLASYGVLNEEGGEQE